MNEKILASTLENIINRVEALESKVKAQQLHIDFIEKKRNSELQISLPIAENNADELLTMLQVRKLLNCSRNSVLKLVKDGLLMVKKVSKRSVRYSRIQVQKFIKEL